jgi:hypothetical protein
MQEPFDVQFATHLLEDDIEEAIATARTSNVPIAAVLEILEEAIRRVTAEYQGDK